MAGRQRGVALVVVLWVLVFIAVLASVVSRDTRTQSHLARNLLERAQAEALADAGLNRAVIGLAADIEGSGIRTDGTVYTWAFAGGDVRMTVRDEGGKVDLNEASPETLARVFRAAGADEQESVALAAAAVDFRDADSEPQPLGAEDADYLAADLPHDAKDALFEDVAELEQLLGMSPAIYERARDLFTVFSEQPLPDPIALMPELRESFGAVVPPGSNESGDTPNGGGAPVADADLLRGTLTPGNRAANGPAGRSDLGPFSIHVEARLPSGATFVREAVIGLFEGGSQPFSVYRWGQGPLILFRSEQGFSE